MSSYGLPTIYALSTKAGRAAIGIVRVSGPSAKKVYAKLTRSAKPPASRTALLRKIYHPESGILLDQAMALYFQGPRSYTGDDLLELHCHGGNAIVRSVLGALKSLHSSEYPLRYAENGEFSKRAFQNGRVDLTEVEGIRELIDAETESQRVSALSSIQGENKALFQGWRSRIVDQVALLTTVIDFGEDHDIEQVNDLFQTVEGGVKDLQKDIRRYLDKVATSSILLKGIKIILLGPPNAGKSSLLNCLTNKETAIVSEIEGTTRDVIDVPLDINGYKVVLGDTAGIRDVVEAGLIEQEGIKRAKLRSLDGDLVVLVLPANRETVDDEVVKHIEVLKQANKPILVVLNKSDLITDKKRVLQIFQKKLGLGEEDFMLASCTEQVGIKSLLERLTIDFKKITQTENEDPVVISERAQDILVNDVLYGFEEFSRYKQMDDIVLASESLRHAIDGIGKITGESVGVEEILGVVFSSFCIGK